MIGAGVNAGVDTTGGAVAVLVSLPPPPQAASAELISAMAMVCWQVVRLNFFFMCMAIQ